MNEIEIVITGRNQSGPALAEARADARKTGVQIRDDLTKSGRDGGKNAGDGIRDGIESGARRGGQIVSGFASGTLKTFSRLGPLMGAAVTAGLVGAEAAAGASAGAITLALGGAVTTVGMVSAAQSMRVRREWSETGRVLKTELADAAQPMERSAIKAAAVTRRTFGQLKPYLATFFDNSQPSVDRFIKSIGSGVASLGDSLGPLERGYSAVLDAISGRTPAIFANLNDSITELAITAEMSADDIAAALEGVSAVVSGISSSVRFLAEDFDAGSDHWSTFFDELGRGTMIWDAWSKGEAASEAVHRKYADAAAAATAANDGLGDSARGAAAGMRDLAAEFEALTGPALDAAEAQIRVEEAIDRATESIRENGRTLNVNTEKGRANKEALIDIARAAQEHIAAMQAEGASADAITAKYGAYRGQLVAAARQAGRTKEQAERLADAWLAMPESVVTHARGNLSDLERKISAAKAKLKDPNLTHPQRTAIRAEISDLQRKVAQAKASLASIKSRSVSVFVNQIYRSSGIGVGTVLAPQRAHGGITGGLGGVKRFADGGVSGAGSSLAMVGEQGPELVRLPVGSTVTPAGQTRARMGMGGGFGSISMAFRQAQTSGFGDGGAGGLRESLRELVSFRDALEKLSSSLIGQTRAVSAYEAAWDAAGRSLKENGKRLSLTTEKGRENRGALMDLAEAAREVIIAMHEQGRSRSTMLSTMKEQRSEFISMARRMGLSKKDAGAMADRMGLTTAGVRSALAASSGKAAGGPAGGWTMVGERGAELVRLPFGSQVTPAGQTAAMMAAAAPAPVVLELRSSGSAVDDMLLKILRNAVRVRGGNVQLVLGRA
ncbi:hypothetical protein ABZW11_17215 [Nonomuraea sp. NPDC004580]|uniref:hypothetical protein n=1 Tax=Nonomuraea sp. NPDC004580 TaxID=3154552 RepID=UPI0033B0A124